MRFLVDSMLPPAAAERLRSLGHDALTPADLGAHNLPDDELIRIAAVEHRVIITENASDFARASGPVLLVRKSWWPAPALADRLDSAADRWALREPEPGPWAHWLDAELR